MRIVRLSVGNITRGEIFPIEFVFIETTLIPHLESGALQFVSLMRNLLHGYGSSAIHVLNLQIFQLRYYSRRDLSLKPNHPMFRSGALTF